LVTPPYPNILNAFFLTGKYPIVAACNRIVAYVFYIE